MQIDSVIQNKNILLQPLRAEDASAAYLGWLADPLISSFLEVRFNPPRSLMELESYIVMAAQDPDSLLLGIFLRNDAKHIGNIKLGPINRHHRIADVGFLIGEREQWGKGYASQAITLISDYGFQQLGLAKIAAGCYEANEGSQRALLKAGFKVEGRLISQWDVGGCRQDGFLFGKVNPELTIR